MHWVLQDNLYSEEGFGKLCGTLARLEIPYSIHKVIPFIRKLEPDFDTTGKAIVIGSYSLAYIAQEKGWDPGAFIGPELDYEYQRCYWLDWMLNYDARMLPLRDVPFQKEPFFIRPVTDSKSFSGTVMDWEEFETWRKQIDALTPEDNPHVTLDTRVMVAKKKQIYNENRFWIVDGEVVTWSLYKRGSLVINPSRRVINPRGYETDPEAINFARKVNEHWRPLPTYCMDVAATPEGYKIIEVNNLNSSGFYDANMGKLIVALEKAYG